MPLAPQGHAPGTGTPTPSIPQTTRAPGKNRRTPPHPHVAKWASTHKFARFPNNQTELGRRPIARTRERAWIDAAFPWSLNPDLVELVKQRFSRDDTILGSCRSGGRGAMAVNVLAREGFTNAYNILDGMEGSRVDDPDSVFNGLRRKNGWQMSGLPWTYELDRDRISLPEHEETGTLHPGNPED